MPARRDSRTARAWLRKRPAAPLNGSMLRGELDATTFRAAMGRFPTGVTLLTQGTPDVMEAITANSFISVSLHPPLILVSVRADSRMRVRLDTCTTFAVQVLQDGQEHLAGLFARHERPAGAQAARMVEAAASALGNALIPGAVAQFECLPQEQYPGGDHILYLARVATIHLAAEGRAPLLFHRGAYTVPRPARSAPVASSNRIEIGK